MTTWPRSTLFLRPGPTPAGPASCADALPHGQPVKAPSLVTRRVPPRRNATRHLPQGTTRRVSPARRDGGVRLVHRADPGPGPPGCDLLRLRCRQARHGFLRAAGQAAPVAGGRPLRLAYADPPYPGKAWRYRGHPDYAGEVDHAALIGRLAGYDGRALSTSAEALPGVLALCPPGVRVAAWHRGERPTASRWPLHAWEPVIYSGGRRSSVTSAAPARRFDRVRRRRGHHPARAGDRRQTGCGVPVDLRSARRRARRHPR